MQSKKEDLESVRQERCRCRVRVDVGRRLRLERRAVAVASGPHTAHRPPPTAAHCRPPEGKLAGMASASELNFGKVQPAIARTA